MFYVQSLDESKKEPLNPLMLSGFVVSQNVDGGLTVSFTSLKGTVDNNPGHELLENKGIVHVHGYDYRIEQYSDTAYSKSITAISILYDHNKTQIEKTFGGNHTLLNHLDFALKGTGWTCDIDITIADKINYIEDLGNDNVISVLEKIKKYHGVEYLILPDKHLYVAKEIGPENDFVYRYKHNVSDVVLKKDTTNLSTVIKGYGANGLVAEYVSPNASVFGRLEADPIRDERITNSESLLDHLATQIQDEPSIVIESKVPYLTERSIGERVWLNYEPLGINIKVRIVDQTKILVGGKLVTASVVFGNTIYKTSIDTAVEQQIRIKETTKELYLAKEEYRKRFEEEREETNQLIQVAANGKNAIYRSVEEPIGELKDGDLWYKPLGNGETQLYQYGNNVWGLVLDTSDLTVIEQAVDEAKQDAQSAVIAANNAEQRANAAIGNANTAISNAQTAFNKAQEALQKEIRPINLARFTNMKYFTNWGSATTITYDDIDNNYFSVKAKNSLTTGTWGAQQSNAARLMALVNGKTYTLSFKAKTSEPLDLNYIYVINSTGANQSLQGIATNIKATTEWKEFSITFTNTRPNGTTSSILIGNNSTRSANTTIEVKDLAVYEGEKNYGWFPAPDDIGYEFAQFKVFDDAIAARVNGNEGNVTSLTATVSGLQTTVASKVDTTTYNSYVTQTAQTLNSKLSSTDATSIYATQSSLTQTSNSLISRIDNIQIGGRNLYQGTKDFSGLKWMNIGSWETDGTYQGFVVKKRRDLWSGLGQYVSVKAGQQYTFSFFAKADASIGTVRLYGTGVGNNPTVMNGIAIENISTEWQRYEITFTSLITADDIYFRLEKQTDTSQTKYLYLCGLKLENGNKATDWTPAPEDTNSQIAQLTDNINLKVSKNGIVNQINLSTEGVLISGNKIRITGQTVIDDAAITSAKIASLDATKITTGTLNAANVNIVNLSASNITTGTLNAARIASNSITADKLNVTTLSAITSNIGTVNVGTINGVNINSANINISQDVKSEIT